MDANFNQYDFKDKIVTHHKYTFSEDNTDYADGINICFSDGTTMRITASSHKGEPTINYDIIKKKKPRYHGCK